MSARRAAWVALAATVAALVGVAMETPTVDAAPSHDVVLVANEARLRASYRRPASVPYPADNAPTPARIAVGKALFFDGRVSGARDISCASCHMPDRGWEDGRATAIGSRGQQLARHTPTVLNTAFAAALFWDGRAATL